MPKPFYWTITKIVLEYCAFCTKVELMSHLDQIIKKMGYTESEGLRYGLNFDDMQLSAHNIKILNILSPYAVYFVKHEPFVIFYEKTTDVEEQRQRSRNIWNAQIPITIICDSKHVTIYSTCDFNREKLALSEVVSIPVENLDENSPFSFWEITNQDFWNTYEKVFRGDTLNEYLLANLTEITDRLRNTYKISFATKLILRLIFIRYLVDRKVDLDYPGFSSNEVSSRQALKEILADKEKLYELFAHLKSKFNGNLFELSDDTSLLTEEVLQMLSGFLSADVWSTSGQLAFFALYDFNLIPVELISNIYEILLGKSAREQSNTFYTPKYLVDYILDGGISDYIAKNESCKILDPSCGSGIFLVESYRKMVEKVLDGKPYTDNDDLLRTILTENIFGIDLNEDAIDVAMFSLYLAVLDYKNPKTLKEFQLPNLKRHNLIIGDFFDPSAVSPLEFVKFDFIVGNPPWGKGTDLQTEYIKTHSYERFDQNKDTCRAFVLRSKDFASMKTQCNFILHSTLLYMQKIPSKKFREFLLKETTMTRIVELSSVRKLIFKTAIAPAVILTYSFSAERALDNRFEYVSVKPNIFFSLFNIFVIEKNDIKFVQQRFLESNDWAWKTLVYGFSGDVEILLKTKAKFNTLTEAIKCQTPRLLRGAGIRDNPGGIDSSHLMYRELLNTEAVSHFNLDKRNISVFKKPMIHRPSNERLFHAPYCLFRTGIDTKNFTMRAVFLETDFLFKEAIYAIKGDISQKAFLLNLTGLLNSSLFAYFNLMLGSHAGIEREKRLVDEVLGFPFVFDQKIVDKVEIIQNKLASDMFSEMAGIEAEMSALNDLVLQAFGLNGNAFIDYALNVQIPQITGSKAHNAVEERELVAYARVLLEALSPIFEVSGKYVSVNIYHNMTKYYSAIEVVIHDTKPPQLIQAMTDASSLQIAWTRFSHYKVSDFFFELKDIIHFGNDSFYIAKPNSYKNWHPAVALVDLSEVVEQILSRDGRE